MHCTCMGDVSCEPPRECVRTCNKATQHTTTNDPKPPQTPVIQRYDVGTVSTPGVNVNVNVNVSVVLPISATLR